MRGGCELPFLLFFFSIKMMSYFMFRFKSYFWTVFSCNLSLSTLFLDTRTIRVHVCKITDIRPFECWGTKIKKKDISSSYSFVV